MNRILEIPISEIAADPERASELLNAACRHSRKMRLAGCCQADDMAIVSFEETSKPSKLKHVFAPFSDESCHGAVDEINARYAYGFTTVASLRVGGRLWGLFSFDPDAKSVHP